ncbi:uroplakin-3b-like protein 2 isoform X8 [Equus asinus]|uniref:uroplakin-3b-like protein 2 isoform X8 n=1 Tax=Equus asinus TaxID=9793 RepID=UPI0038F66CD9
MGLSGGQSRLLMPLLLLLTSLQPGAGLGTVTQSTFTLEQPRGQFSHPSISDFDAIWLVVARGNGSQPSTQLRVLRVGNDTRCSPRTRGCNHPLPGPGPYRVKFLVMSDRGPVAETQWSSETRLQQDLFPPCLWGPPTPSAQALQAAPGPQSAGTVVITAVLSILLALVLTALLALLVYTCYDTCQSTPISGPGEPVGVRRYNTHHMFSPPAVGGS